MSSRAPATSCGRSRSSGRNPSSPSAERHDQGVLFQYERFIFPYQRGISYSHSLIRISLRARLSVVYPLQVEKMTADMEKSEASVRKQADYITRLETRLLRLAGRAAVSGAPAMPHSPPSAAAAAAAAANGGSPSRPAAAAAQNGDAETHGGGSPVEELTGRFEEGLLQELAQLRATVEEFGARAVRVRNV